MLLLLPALIALVLEPIVFLAADRWPRRWFLRGGLAAMAICALAAASAPGPWSFSIALSFGAVASGTATALAQATLVDRHPGARERVMVRWMLFGLAGSLGGPILLAGLHWRTAFAIVAVLLAAWCAFSWRVPIEAALSDEEEEQAAAQFAGGSLWRWLGACALCSLLDDILFVFASLHLRDVLGAGPGERAVVLGAFIAGGAAGVMWTDRLLTRHAPLRVLQVACVACAAVYAAWLAAPTWWLSALGMLLVGATTAPLYPICVAQAYAALPGRSGAVNAAGHVFTPLQMVAPFLLGLLADRAGTFPALACLIAQPLGVLVLASSLRRRR